MTRRRNPGEASAFYYHGKRIRAGGGSLWREEGLSYLSHTVAHDSQPLSLASLNVAHTMFRDILRWVRLNTSVKDIHGLAAEGTLSLRISVAATALGVSCASVSLGLSPRRTMIKAEGALPVPQGDASLPSCGDAPSPPISSESSMRHPARQTALHTLRVGARLLLQ